MVRRAHAGAPFEFTVSKRQPLGIGQPNIEPAPARRSNSLGTGIDTSNTNPALLRLIDEITVSTTNVQQAFRRERKHPFGEFVRVPLNGIVQRHYRLIWPSSAFWIFSP